MNKVTEIYEITAERSQLDIIEKIFNIIEHSEMGNIEYILLHVGIPNKSNKVRIENVKNEIEFITNEKDNELDITQVKRYKAYYLDLGIYI